MCFWDINSSSTTSLLVCKRRFEYRYFASIFLLDAHVVLFVSIYYSHPRADARVNVFKGLCFLLLFFKDFLRDEKEKNSANAALVLPSLSLPSLRRRTQSFRKSPQKQRAQIPHTHRERIRARPRRDTVRADNNTSDTKSSDDRKKRPV